MADSPPGSFVQGAPSVTARAMIERSREGARDEQGRRELGPSCNALRLPVVTTKSARSVSSSQAARRPLRRIVGQEYDDATDRILEHLECGHVTPQRCDSMGPTNAYRRRCYKCPERGSDD